MNYSYFSYTRVIAAVVFFTGIILLWPAKLFFLNDDFIHLDLTSQGKWLQQNSFRPLCDLSMWVDYKLWKLNAVGFHLTNGILHVVVTFLVYRFSFLILRKYHQPVIASSNSTLIASIFFVYAFHAETLYWVIGRSASLGAFFFLSSLIYYLKRAASVKYSALSIIFFVAGLFTYESTWIIPLVFTVISAMEVKSGTSNWISERKYIGFSIIAFICYFIIRYISIHQVVGTYEGDKFLRFDAYGLLMNYLKLILRSFSKQTGDLYLIVAALFIGVTALISFCITKRKLFTVGLIVMWLLSYLPYLSLGTDTFGTEGERYLYLPSVFLCIIIGLGIVNAARVYKYVISLLFFLVHILLLYDARRNYETASAVTNTTVKELREAGAGKQFYFIALPKENKGALIFRDGLQQAIHLFADTSNTFQVHSYYDGNFESFHGSSEEDPLGIKARSGTQVIFDYSKNSLIISYLPPGTISE